MPKRCFILDGNGASLNRGCQAILRATVGMLREEFGPCLFINAPAAMGERRSDTESGEEFIHLLPQPLRRWRPRWVWHKMKRKLHVGGTTSALPFTRYLRRADAVLALGGDNYSLDYGRPDRFFQAADVTLHAGRPYVIWGASIGPFTSDQEFERAAAKSLKQVTLICARESETVKYLTKLGVANNVVQAADPAFLLRPKPVILDPALESALQGPCLGLNLSELVGRYRRYPERWTKEAVDCVTSLLKMTELPIVMVPHVVMSRCDDYRFLAKIRERIAAPAERVFLVERHHDAQELKWIISQLHAFIGARAHATIAALSSCVPTLSLGYSVKSRGINLDLFGHINHVLPVDKLEPGRLVAETRALLANRDKIRQHLRETMPAYCETAKLATIHLRRVLEASSNYLPLVASH